MVERALGRRNVGPYQLQAAIAAVHAEAATAAETDWKQIAALYAILSASQPSPIVSLNHAVAIAMGESLERGLALIDSLGSSGELDSYHLTMLPVPTCCVVWAATGKQARVTTAGSLSPPMPSKCAISAAVSPSLTYSRSSFHNTPR